MVQKRNYGIDLLRLVLMFMVGLLHVLEQGGILEACSAGTVPYYVYHLISVMAFGAVDGFALISGYVASDRPQRYEKIVEMWFQVFFYSFVVSLLLTAVGVNPHWSKKEILFCLIPISAGKYWYFTAYFVLFLAMPMLNKFLFSLEERSAGKTFVVLVVVFSGMGMITDAFRTSIGFSAIWLIVLYCIGLLAKRIHLFEQRKSWQLAGIWIVCIVVTWIVQTTFGTKKLTTYISPTIVLSALMLVLLFSRLKLRGSVIAHLSPLAFGVYLLQLNGIIWTNILKDAFLFVLNQNIVCGVLSVLGGAAAIFCSGLAVEYVRARLAVWMKIPAFSKKIVQMLNQGLERLCSMLG